MKMSRQNPGGEGALKGSMKGCESYQARGKGDLKPFTPGKGIGGLSGPKTPGSGHVHKSMSGSTVSGSSKACR